MSRKHDASCLHAPAPEIKERLADLSAPTGHMGALGARTEQIAGEG